MFPASAVVIHLRPVFKTISTSTAVVWPLASMFLASAVTTYLWPVFKTTTTSTAVVWPLASLSPASAVITYICILITTSTSSAVVWSLACSSSASAVNTFFAKMTLRTSTVHTNNVSICTSTAFITVCAFCLHPLLSHVDDSPTVVNNSLAFGRCR